MPDSKDEYLLKAEEKNDGRISANVEKGRAGTSFEKLSFMSFSCVLSVQWCRGGG